MNYKLSPSDLTFLYDGCRRCFVLKVKHGIAQPSIPLPGIFSTISYLQKEHYSEKRTEEICPGLPPGVIKYSKGRGTSRIMTHDISDSFQQRPLDLKLILSGD
ncbi:MAG: hypothetical protein KAV87_33115 [Desulfobacteraceae bacterium]|nr:hypothetical protein [Desulfobacteraceae bacterium]